MHIVIPDELVPLLRDGLYSDLHGQLEEAGALIEPRSRRADTRVSVNGCLARTTDTRALLDVVGWIEPVDPPTVVEIDVRRHRTALLRALLTRIESEHSVEEDQKPARRTARWQRRGSASLRTSSPKRKRETHEHGPDPGLVRGPAA